MIKPNRWEPTHLDKLYWPEAGISKGDLIAYYARVAKTLLPYLKDRPLSLKRYPEGLQGESFFQKNIADAVLPEFLTLAAIRAKTTNKNVHYMVCNNQETLAYLANIGALELHPWNSRLKSKNNPDYLVLDLDPGENASFGDVVEAALAVKEVLDEARIRSFVKTSGKRGMHIYVPLGAQYTYEKVRRFAKNIAQVVVERHPALASLEVHPKDRKDKVYIDYLRNAAGQTVAAPYCPRAVLEATVAAPLEWREVKRGLDPKKFTVASMPKRIAAGDPWKLIFKTKNNLDAAAKQLGL